jgi:hypothetical protein
MFEIIALIVVLLIAAVLIYAATKPDRFRVSADQHQGGPEKIFPLINDFTIGQPGLHGRMDFCEEIQRSLTGQGPVQWDGNKVGTGRMEIIETPPQVPVKLDFITV